MPRIYVNNFSSFITSDITDVATSITINSATGLPTLTGSQYYYLTLDNSVGPIEIVKVTARTGNTLTVVRGQESTTAVEWLTNSVIEMRETAESFTPGAIISGQSLTTVTAASGDLIMLQDVSDSNNLKVCLASDLTGGSSSDSFKTIAISGQSDVVADSATDTLTLVAGANITLTTNAGTDTITIAGTGGATLGDGDYGDVTVTTSGTVITIDTPASATIANDDKVLIKDTSASDVMKYVTTQSVRDLVPGSATLTSAQLATSLTDETGSGAAVFATSPTLVTPVLGTPSSGTLTNCTGYVEASLVTTDVTTNDASTAKHGFLKKLSNTATEYMDGTGNWSVPAGGGGITAVVDDTSPQLGGDLDVNGNSITSSGVIELEPNSAVYLKPTNTSLAGSIDFYEASTNGSNYIKVRAPASVGADYNFTLPPDSGTNTYVLQTDGSGTTTWVAPGGGIVDLTTDVTGVLPVANGGTGVTSSKAIIQQVFTTTGAMASGSTTMPLDNTTPQSGEGNEYMTLAITPTNSSNILEIEVCAFLSNSANESTQMALFQDSGANCLKSAMQFGGVNAALGLVLKHRMAAGTTSSTTFKVRAGRTTAGTVTFNGYAATSYLNGTLASYIKITEYVV